LRNGFRAHKVQTGENWAARAIYEFEEE
jgi:hypothetical protein